MTVGACTNLTQITGPGTQSYKTIAPDGGLSPFSTTALGWQPQWPLKPDIVLEGGNAAELASRAQIAVFPTIGWWRTRPRLGCANRTARYALAVSIRAPETDVDLYTEVANQIAVSIEA